MATDSLGTFNTDPNGPLDMSKYISGVTDQAYKNWQNQQDQMKWAKDQFAKNEATADTVSKRALDTSAQFGDYAARDRALYEDTYVPAMKEQMDFARGYTTPERMQANRAGAGAQVGVAFDAQRDAAERSLTSTGVDPSSGRFAGLDAGLAAKRAATAAAAMTKSDRDTEAMGQEYLNRAIQTGAVLPGQTVNEAGTSIAAGNQAVNAPLAATASGAATMGTPLQWNQQGNDMFKQWMPAAVAQQQAGEQMNRDVFSSNLDMMKLQQQKEKENSSGAGAAIGAGMGILGTVAGAYFGGPMGASVGGKLGSSMGSAMGGSGMGFAEGGVVEEDMTDQYNTPLDDAEEKGYHEWAEQNHRQGDTFDYDMRGAWKQGERGDPSTGHFPDTYKKPNHPTFSDQSQYHGAGGRMGGRWDYDETGSETLQPYDPRYHADGGRIEMINRFANGGDIMDEEMPPEEEMGDGGDNMVPPEASPSGGAETDDVHAMVSEGEFVMPKDVTAWYGEKFMQNLINKARKESAGPKAEGQPGPPVQAMALAPPSFHSEGARMGA